MRFFPLGICIFVLAGMLTACASPKNLFVLLPEDDGTVGRISVTNPQGSQTLDRAWQSTDVANAASAPGVPKDLPPDQVRQLFAGALEAQPRPSMRFVLYFQPSSKELTEESKAQIPGVIDAIRLRQSVDTSVVGHTDTVGTNEFNVRLSMERAELIANRLIDEGIDPAILEVSSHGERNLLISTADEVAEPLNRRVEITVR